MSTLWREALLEQNSFNYRQMTTTLPASTATELHLQPCKHQVPFCVPCPAVFDSVNVLLVSKHLQSQNLWSNPVCTHIISSAVLLQVAGHLFEGMLSQCAYLFKSCRLLCSSGSASSCRG